MTGYESKKMVRWLGPYPPGSRYADIVTVDHIIELRKKLAEAERQRDNALAGLTELHRMYNDLRGLNEQKGQGDKRSILQMWSRYRRN